MRGNVSKNNGFDLNKQIIDAIDEKVEALIALKYILTVQKNNPNGVAGLDENGKILNSQIPDDVKNGLSSNDFTDELKSKLDGLSNYDDAEVKSDISDLKSGKVDKISDMGLSKIKNISKTEQPCVLDDDGSKGWITNISIIDQNDEYKNITTFYELDTLDTLLSKKTDKPTLSSDTESINIDTNSGNKVTVLTANGVSTLVSGKQDKLTFDDVPTANSDNPVKSEGILAELNKKANKANNFGGFNGGQSSQATQGGAVGYNSTATDGGAVGVNAFTQDGGAVGMSAHAKNGGAVGQGSETTNGGAVGESAVAGDGFAGGKNAQATKNDEPIDAVQLGTGVNQNQKTLQVYSYQLMDSTGHIPNDRMPTKSDKTTYLSPTTTGAITYDLLNENNRSTTYLTSSAATSVAISVSDGTYSNDYISGLSFKTGSAAPETSYTANSNTLVWVGSECSVSGSSSVFAPIANKVYDIVFYFNGANFVGLVNGYSVQAEAEA